MDRIFYAMVVIAFVAAAVPQLAIDIAAPMCWGLPLAEVRPMADLGDGAMSSAKAAVELAISLVGYMALFLGLMKVAEDGGALKVVSKLLRPLMTRLFPDVPAEHPAMGAMILNMSANALGLGNAATPFGIKAMQALDELNPHPGTATNSMALFLAINTSSVTLLPTGVIAIRASLDSGDPAGIMGPTLLATVCSTTVAISACFLYARFWPSPPPEREVEQPESEAGGLSLPLLVLGVMLLGVAEALLVVFGPWWLVALASLALVGVMYAGISLSTDTDAFPTWVSLVALGSLPGFAAVCILYGSIVAPWIVPLIIATLLTFGVVTGVNVYTSLVEGAKQGFDVAIRIIPFLVAILAAVGMVRSSGALDLMVSTVGVFSAPLGMPAEALPMALIRPLSGSGAFGVLMDTMNTHGADSYIGYLVSTLQGSTETTFYVLAVYFGAVGVHRIRHSMAAALTADFAGICGAVLGASLYFSML